MAKKAICVSDDGVVTEAKEGEHADVYYDENGKIKTVSIRLLLLLAAGLGRMPESEVSK